MRSVEAARPDRPSLPFTPSDIPNHLAFVRAVAAYCVAAARGPSSFPEAVCRQLWPKDAVSLAIVQRAATGPATIGGSNWASQLAATAISSFVGTLQQSAGARLIAAGLQLNGLPGYAQITLPRAAFTGTPGWVAEGAPIPVAQGVTAAAVLGPPKKLGLFEVVTRELAEAAAEDIENSIGQMLRDALGRALDLGIFSATASDATRPAGILNGLTATTASTGAAGSLAAIADLRLLLDATVTAGGSGAALFFCSPGRALAIKGYVPALASNVYGSAPIGGGTLIAVDPNAFASMFGSDPEIRASREAVLHFESTAPAQIGTVGTPPVVAAPSEEMFQSDVIALRAILKCAWQMRLPAVAFISAALSW
jgi:hypothetical protein